MLTLAEIPVDDIYRKVVIPELCQLEKGIAILDAHRQEHRFVGTLFMGLMDHMELVKLLHIPGTIFLSFLQELM